MIACVESRWLAIVAAMTGLFAACGDDDPQGPTSTESGTTMTLTEEGTADAAPTTTGTTEVADDTAGGSTLGLSTSTGAGDTTVGLDDTVGDVSTTASPNLGPTAHHDGYAILFGTAELVVDAAGGVLSNDRDPENDLLTVTDFDAVSEQGGTVEIDDEGALTYTAPTEYWGEDRFGYSIEDSAGNSAQGVVNVALAPTLIGVGEPASGPYGFRIDGAQSALEVGTVVAQGGDVNGDGLDDVLVASTAAAGDVGAVWVVFGQDVATAVDLADVTLGIGGFVITGAASGEDFAASLGGGGDFNGDGLADIVIGALGAGNAGQAYVVHGKADGDEVTLAELALGTGGFVLSGQVVGDDAGTAVAMVGDVNGDGLDDMAIGAPGAGTVPGAGRTYIVHGTAATDAVALSDVLGGMGGFVANGVGIDDLSGSSVGGGADVNGDGLDDVVIGAPQADPGGGNSGAAYVVFGKTDNASVNLANAGDAAFTMQGGASLDIAGTAVSLAGDVNGDGRADVLVGAAGADDDLVFQGQAYVVFGKDDGDAVLLTEVADGVGGFAIDGEVNGHLLGFAVAGAGDIDGDGFADVVLGGANLDFVGSNSGRTHVVFGKTSTARVELSDVSVGLGGFALDGESLLDRLGIAVAGGGDINGDGYADIIVAADRNDTGANNAGAVYVMFGAGWTGQVGYVGGSGADSFVGAPANEGMVAGQGDDVLAGGGGSDVLYAGVGADTIRVEQAQFFRVDGGPGSDTFALADGGVVLNLGVIANNAVVDIEIIDLTGTGDNEILMLGADVRALVGPSRTLQLLGDAGDVATIDLSGGAWAADGSAGGFDFYTDGVHRLEVSTDLDAAVAL